MDILATPAFWVSLSALTFLEIVLGIDNLLFVSIALWWALGDLLDSLGWSAVIVAVIWGIVAAVLYFIGKREFDRVQGMPRTVDSLKKIPDTLKRNEENR